MTVEVYYHVQCGVPFIAFKHGTYQYTASLFHTRISCQPLLSLIYTLPSANSTK